MKILLTILFLHLITSTAFAERARFDNYRVYEISIENVKQSKLMIEIENFPDGVSNKI